MWGHSPKCECPVCATLPRIFSLIESGSQLPGFVPIWGDRLRVIEGELRDHVERAGRPPLVGLPVLPPPGVGLPPKGAKEEEEHPAFAKGAPTPKAEPPSPPKPPPPPEQPLPAEPKGVSPKKEEKEKVEPKAAKPEEKKGKGHRRRRSTKKKREREETPEHSDSSSPPRAASSRPSKEGAERKRKSRGDSRSPSKERGKEKKSRPDRPPEPLNPPRQRWDPPGTTAAPKRGAKGWVGPIPYSDHPRWHKPRTKGITKVIKQEYRDRQRQRGWK